MPDAGSRVRGDGCGIAYGWAAALLDTLAEGESAAVRRFVGRWGSGPRWWGRVPLRGPAGAGVRGGRWPYGAARWPVQQRPGHPSREAVSRAWQS